VKSGVAAVVGGDVSGGVVTDVSVDVVGGAGTAVVPVGLVVGATSAPGQRRACGAISSTSRVVTAHTASRSMVTPGSMRCSISTE
jgi:hypothetical protein